MSNNKTIAKLFLVKMLLMSSMIILLTLSSCSYFSINEKRGTDVTYNHAAPQVKKGKFSYTKQYPKSRKNCN